MNEKKIKYSIEFVRNDYVKFKNIKKTGRLYKIVKMQRIVRK